MIAPYLTLIGTLMLVLFPGLLLIMIPVVVTLAPITRRGAQRIVSGVASWQQALGRIIGGQRPAPRFAV